MGSVTTELKAHSNTAIVVYTEWLDQDGRALPEALGDYGYTARFAKIVAPNQLDDAAVGQADDGSGASYDNARAETINGLYKAEVVHKQAWKN